MPPEELDDALRERLLGRRTIDDAIRVLKDAGAELGDGEVAAIAMAVCRGWPRAGSCQ